MVKAKIVVLIIVVILIVFYFTACNNGNGSDTHLIESRDKLLGRWEFNNDGKLDEWQFLTDGAWLVYEPREIHEWRWHIDDDNKLILRGYGDIFICDFDISDNILTITYTSSGEEHEDILRRLH
jgi:predicted small secreted protein